MEQSFCELRSKEIINVSNGKSLGHMIDLIFDVDCAKILGIVVPGKCGIFSAFSKNSDIFIPFHCICKIGVDVILVDFINAPNQAKGISFNN